MLIKKNSWHLVSPLHVFVRNTLTHLPSWVCSLVVGERDWCITSNDQEKRHDSPQSYVCIDVFIFLWTLQLYLWRWSVERIYFQHIYRIYKNITLRNLNNIMLMKIWQRFHFICCSCVCLSLIYFFQIPFYTLISDHSRSICQ